MSTAGGRRSNGGQGGQEHDDPFDAPAGKHIIAQDGFNLHAAVAVRADDDISRETLVRYCARPAFAHERISVLRDGRVAYAIKRPRKSGTHRILTPVELIARIAALIPPPRCPFLRYHGVLARRVPQLLPLRALVEAWRHSNG